MIPKEEVRPLLDWVLRKHPDTPKSRAKQWILAGRVSVNGVVIRKPHQEFPNPGASLQLLDRHAGTLDCGGSWQIHPRVALLYLDTSLAVVDKGAGLVSVPSSNTGISALSILADFLEGKIRPLKRSDKLLPPAYRRLEPLPVHRLDQYTTGVFCMATNPDSRRHLIEQVKAHTMRRQYVAYVEGEPAAAKGTWRHWLQLSTDQMRQDIVSGPRSSRQSDSGPTEAITHFELIEQFRSTDGKSVFSKLHLELETGLKHQIRIQAAEAGVPLVGDRTYNPNYKPSSRVRTVVEFSRQALHAEALSLEHPSHPGKQMTWKAPLPKDLVELETLLRRGLR